jgi:hypothetical protein
MRFACSFLAVAMFYLNCADSVVLHTHSEHWQHFWSVLLSLAVGQIEHLPSHLSPHFFTGEGEAGCMQGTPIACLAL